MKKTDVVVAVALGVVIVMAVQYFQPREPELQELELPPGADMQPAAVEVPEPVIRYPIPEHPPLVEKPIAEPEIIESEQIEPGFQQEEPVEEAIETAPVPEKPLPTLADSDDVVRADLYTLATRKLVDSLLNLNRIIPRFVVTVDNLPRKHLSNSKYRSNQAIGGQPVVVEDSLGLYLSEQNFARYNAFVSLLENMDSDRMIALYLHYYPLVQTAYEDLGYPSAYFNDRLIDVIDHLLEAPDIGGRISLVRPRVLYKYADPELEALSAGQKILVRIGPRNAARVKSKLRELRQALAGG